MCRATHEPGGPQRCSGDTRSSLASSVRAVAVLERAEAALESALDSPARQPSAAGPTSAGVVSFADKDRRNEDIRREIDEAIANLNTAEQWQDWLSYAGKFHNYSFNNQLLIRMQRPDATQVAGFRKWHEMGRDVQAGQKAIWIWAPKTIRAKAPCPPGATPDGQEDGKPFVYKRVVTGFKPISVFDVAQTAGDPLPSRPVVPYSPHEGAAPPDMAPALQAQIVAHGYTVEYQDLPEGGPEGYTSHAMKKVVVSTRFASAHQAVVLAHELAHIELGHMEQHHEYHSGPGGQRPTMEVEAESVAYVIGRRFGLDPGPSAFAYIDGWAKGDRTKVAQTADRVVKAVDAIFSRITPATTH
jgi:hypothetical protein